METRTTAKTKAMTTTKLLVSEQPVLKKRPGELSSNGNSLWNIRRSSNQPKRSEVATTLIAERLNTSFKKDEIGSK